MILLRMVEPHSPILLKVSGATVRRLFFRERRDSLSALRGQDVFLVARFVVEQNFVFNGAPQPALPVQGNDARPGLIEVEHRPAG